MSHQRLFPSFPIPHVGHFVPAGKILPPAIGYALSFDGSDDYVQVPAIFSGLSAITVELWFKRLGTGGSTWGDRLISQFDGGAAYDVWDMPVWTALMARLQTSEGYANLSGGTISLNEWYYGVFTWDGATARLYLNAVEVDSVAIGGTMNVQTTFNCRIGCRQDALLEEFYGIIDEVRISNIARTPSEITDNYNAGVGKKLVADAYTLLLYHLDEGTGTTAGDESANAYHGTIYGATWTEGKVPV